MYGWKWVGRCCGYVAGSRLVGGWLAGFLGFYEKVISSDLVLARRWIASSASDVDSILGQLLHFHVGEVADHVRQKVQSGVPNFIQQLLTHCAPGHPASRVGWFG